ncbi:hypothetical protein [Micromonospora sp. WMMC273]|uniref:hypothetical protein n=1 Tax=Micromonospora sp. WMMC273 TaxID=3015157 RepID=UPI0022B602A0|nr:hypothetical protein [Micromonospora sp. WMMC273]MCZ7478899.1 hypothetical protein [Micromonospora sp. WMMC273]
MDSTWLANVRPHPNTVPWAQAQNPTGDHAKTVLLLVAQNSVRDGYFFPDIHDLTDLSGLTDSQVGGALTQLMNQGLLAYCNASPDLTYVLPAASRR